MNNSLITLLLWLLCHGTMLVGQSYQGILPKIETNADSLIREVFVAGQCIDIESVRSQSQFGQVGTFTNGLSSVGIEEGIILSTGNVLNARGPNNEDDAGTGFGQSYNDPDFAVIANASTQYDLAYLEFDFIPTVDFVRFEYVFASEEYCEFSSSPTFNDAFAFLISGPGINGPFSNGAENIARLPSGAFVSANTINYFVNPQFYVGNVAPNTTLFCPNSPATALALTEFDGFTTVLTAAIAVIPCERYRIRLAIMDKNDDVYDSAVFLKASSFNAGIPATLSSNISAQGLGTSQPYEGCSDVFFIFDRVGGDTTQDLTVYFTLDPNSTAEEGTDFAPLPDSIVIGANALQDTLRLSILRDNLPEGEETITIRLLNPCYCDNSSVTIRIIDPPPLAVSQPDTTACYGKNLALQAAISGGVSPYLFDWGNGDTDSVLQLTPLVSQALRLEVTDQCGQQVSVDFDLDVERLEASFQGDDFVCVGRPEAQLSVLLSGADSYDLEVLFENDTLRYTSLADGEFLLPAQQAGTYQLLHLSSERCSQSLFKSAQVDTVVLQIDSQVSPPACAGDAAGSINLTVSGGLMPYTYQWQGSNSLGPTADQLAAGVYSVEIADAAGCVVRDSFALLEPSPLSLLIDSLQHPDCVQAGGIIYSTAVGGTSPYAWFYAGNATNATIEDLAPGQHSILVRDALGCESVQVVNLSDLRTIPSAMVTAEGSLNCYQASVLLRANPQAGASYLWTGPMGDISQANEIDSLRVDGAGTYQLIVRNQSAACADTTTITLVSDFEAPPIEAGPEVRLSCTSPQLSLSGSTPGFGGVASWQWFSPGIVIDDPSSLQITIQEPGWYYATATDIANGCQSIDSLLVVADGIAPDLALSMPDTLSCTLTSLSLQAVASGQGSISYTWSTAEGLIEGPNNEPQVQVSRGGWYYLQASDNSNGCAATDSLLVIENQLPPEVSTRVDSVLNCRQPFVEVAGQTTALVPSWTWLTLDGLPLSQTDSVRITVAGTYLLQVKDLSNGCEARDTFSVASSFETPNPQAGPDTELNCLQPSLSLLGNSDPSQQASLLFWLNSDGDTLSSGATSSGALALTVNQAGLYVLQATYLHNGCSQKDSLLVGADFEAPALALSLPDTLNCVRTQVNLQVQSSTLHPLSYLWQAPPPSQLTGPIDEATASAASSGWYYVTVSKLDNGCSTTDSVQVSADFSLPSVEAGNMDTLNCQTPSLLLAGSGQAAGGLSFLWTGPSATAILSGQQSAQALVQEAGWYQLTARSNRNGCTQTDSVRITADTLSPMLSALAEGAISCTVDQVQLLPSEINSRYHYQWLSPAGLSTDAPVLLANTPGDYQLTVRDLSNGCTQTIQVSVVDNTSPPQAAVQSNQAYLDCSTGVAQLEGTGSSSQSGMILYEWSVQLPSGDFATLPNGDQSSVVVDVAGLYQLIVLDPVNGCADSTRVSVGGYPPLEALLSTRAPLCAGERAEISFTAVSGGLPPFSYSIDGGQSFGTTAVFDDLPPATYAWVVEDLNGCRVSGEVVFTEPEPLILSLPEQWVLDFGASLLLEPLLSPDTTTLQWAQWSPSTGLSCINCLSTQASPPTTQSYTLRVTSQNGCTAEAKIRIIVDQRPNIYIPNAFSPYDENGINDFFTIYAPAEVVKTISEFKVFDRWGGLVFQAGPIPAGVEAVGWDGLWRGQQLNPGIYVYYLSVELADGREWLLKGEVTLLK